MTERERVALPRQGELAHLGVQLLGLRTPRLLFYTLLEYHMIEINHFIFSALTKEGGRRFMAAWRKEEVDAARHRQEKREATRLGTLLSQTGV